MWVVIGDKKTRQSWECPDCGYESFVYPIEYEDIGVPMCGECGSLMVYNRTEMNTEVCDV
jgi:transcription elongation factor Elf1